MEPRGHGPGAASGRAGAVAQVFPKLSTMTQRPAGAALLRQLGSRARARRSSTSRRRIRRTRRWRRRSRTSARWWRTRTGVEGTAAAVSVVQPVEPPGRDFPGRSQHADDAAGHSHRYRRRSATISSAPPASSASRTGFACCRIWTQPLRRHSLQRSDGGVRRLLSAREEHDVQRRRGRDVQVLRGRGEPLRSERHGTRAAGRAQRHPRQARASRSSMSPRPDGTRTSASSTASLAHEHVSLWPTISTAAWARWWRTCKASGDLSRP